MSNRVWVCDDEPSTRFPLYTRGNVSEVFVEAVSPLTWSAYGPHSWDPGWRDALYRMGVFTPEEFRPEGECEVTGCYGGYIYLNVSLQRTLAVRMPGMTPEAIDHAFFGDHPDVPAYRPDPRDENPDCAQAAAEWLTSLFTTTELPELAEDTARLDDLVAGRPRLAELTDRELVARFRDLRAENRYFFSKHIYLTNCSNVVAAVIAQIAAAVHAPELAAKVTTTLDNPSAQQSFDMWELSRLVAHSEELSAAFDAGVDGLLDRLRASGSVAAKYFVGEWDAFLERWGFLGPSVWEFRSPTYATDPLIPLRMLDRARRAPDDAAPRDKTAALRAERDAAVAEISQRLASSPEVQGQFLGAAGGAGVFLPGRERTKLNCTRMTEEVRANVRELGSRLVDRGVLSRWEQVLLLLDHELDEFLAAPEQFGDLIADRQSRLELLMSKVPPFVFEGEALPLEAFGDRAGVPQPPVTSGDVLTGLPVSQGVYSGPARVIESLDDDSDLEPGEIIVAVTTDSSWGPLFLAAGAVVCQVGAAISHAAIVARELGIPAVVSVPDCVDRIKDGTVLTVDGSTGTVTVG
ncbi:PEP-utilizing enzyme [Nocardia sp. NPDC052112]|uniref:PEP-utilizing enzyme n=1 Tax=Nocardia sp. NPDC052112 TaxID=3155646 RepID=UPI0034194060